jgi:hypothetical protein
MENRYRMLIKSDPARAKVLMEQAQANIRSHQAHYQELAREVADYERTGPTGASVGQPAPAGRVAKIVGTGQAVPTDGRPRS